MILCGAFVFKMWKQINSLERANQGIGAFNLQVTEGSVFQKPVNGVVRSSGAFNLQRALAFLTVAFGLLGLWGSVCTVQRSAVLLVGTAHSSTAGTSSTVPCCSAGMSAGALKALPHGQRGVQLSLTHKSFGIPVLQPQPSEG